MHELAGPPNLGDALLRVVKAMYAARQRSANLRTGVDPRALPLLGALTKGPHRVSSLAQLMHSDISSVSRHVSSLVREGIVEKVADPRDGRAQQLQLTAAGHTLIEGLRAERDAWLDRLLHDWPRSDVRDFAAYLTRFAGELDTFLAADAEAHPHPHHITVKDNT